MEERRRRILTAAGSLIREKNSVDFSMRELATRAGFSLATSYNLIGTKSTVLYALLNSSVEDLTGLLPAARHARLDRTSVIDIISQATSFFTTDPTFYQPLIRFLEGVPDSVNRPIFVRNALRFWQIVVTHATGNDADASRLSVAPAELLHMFFLGGLNRWVHGELTGNEFVRATKAATELILDGVADSWTANRADQ